MYISFTDASKIQIIIITKIRRIQTLNVFGIHLICYLHSEYEDLDLRRKCVVSNGVFIETSRQPNYLLFISKYTFIQEG